MRPGDTGGDPWAGSQPDRPIDIEALRADDELIESLVAGVVRAPRDRSAGGDSTTDPEAELRAMLSAWVLDIRPETVVGADLPASPAPAPPGDRPPTEPAQAPATEPAGVVPITIGRRRLTVHPRYVRRFATAAAMIVLLGSGLAVGAWDAQPGGALWPVTKVFYAERATSIQAAADVTTGLERARTALAVGNRSEAAEAIASVASPLEQVAPAQGHDMLVAQQQKLVVALGDAPIPPDATAVGPATGLPSVAAQAPAATSAAATTSAPGSTAASPSNTPTSAVLSAALVADPPVVAPPVVAPPVVAPPAVTAPADPAPISGPALPAAAQVLISTKAAGPTDTPVATTPVATTPVATKPVPTKPAPADIAAPTSTPAVVAPPAGPAAQAPAAAAPATDRAAAPATSSSATGGGASTGLLGALADIVTSVVGAILHD